MITINGKQYTLVEHKGTRLHKIACEQCAFKDDYMACGDSATRGCMDDLKMHWEEVVNEQQ